MTNAQGRRGPARKTSEGQIGAELYWKAIYEKGEEHPRKKKRMNKREIAGEEKQTAHAL